MMEKTIGILSSDSIARIRQEGFIRRDPSLQTQEIIRCVTCPRRGQENKIFANQISQCTKITFETVRLALRRFKERGGLIESGTEKSNNGGVPRVLYEPTQTFMHAVINKQPLPNCQFNQNAK